MPQWSLHDLCFSGQNNQMLLFVSLYSVSMLSISSSVNIRIGFLLILEDANASKPERDPIGKSRRHALLKFPEENI